MQDLSSEGAKVLHDRCVEIGEKNDVPIITGSTFDENLGTNITYNLEETGVKSIVKKEVSRISIIGYGISSKDGILSEVIEFANRNALEIYNIDISRRKISIVFKELVSDEDLNELHHILIR